MDSTECPKCKGKGYYPKEGKPGDIWYCTCKEGYRLNSYRKREPIP